MQITISGKEEQLYGNPPVNGDKLPKFKLEDADGNKVKNC
ncbi:hypothetical protein NBRC111893_1922 [Lentilactobacillus kosonis]|uniref:Uncharacterized protein n=1 Tax=Lentilactobacillus kosonis TaxID=2810561 RepID=A0A401FN88_9LACO|nr:hypothetical protein NBRC111893_1922 [Lentilactobacillus kosonis]